MTQSEARERLMAAAAHLFLGRGYMAVTIKEIAAQAGIHHASIYHHAPDGKESLYIEVMNRMLGHHKRGIEDALRAHPTLRQQLSAVAAWLLSQPPLDMTRMIYSDLPHIAPQAPQPCSCAPMPPCSPRWSKPSSRRTPAAR